MANRLIGIESGKERIRVAILRRERGGIGILALEELSGDNPVDMIGEVAAQAGGPFSFGDRAATALPAGQGYVRTLTFPFQDRGKIKAAAPLELASQIPVASEECITTLLWPPPSADRNTVVAAAVPITAISDGLAPFDNAEIPLQILDLMPFGLVSGISDCLEDCILVCATGEEVTLTAVMNGRISEHRLIPGTLTRQQPRTFAQVLRECQFMRSHGKDSELPVYLTGAEASQELLNDLHDSGLDITMLELSLGGKLIPPAFVPAVALALRADSHRAEQSFNLRQGQFAYRGELRAASRTLATAAGLLILTLIVAGMTAFIGYRERARQAETLEQQLVQIYQTAFPGTQLTVDVALQMESKLRELRNNAEAVGIVSQPPPWRVLRELSELPAKVPVDVEEFYCDRDEVRISGGTDSFEAVNRIRDQLAASPLFTGVEVAESRKSLEGNRVEFRLRLPLSSKGRTP